ncbi:MAG: DUF2635 domain-containing protein [Alphaproteobacteria bacterium]|nr:DUF2635 domain-containing protein [Alphaproteobacteria bacterium]
MFVKPKPGFKIRDPHRRDHLPPEGRTVPDGDLYWARLLRDGDVTLAAPEFEPRTSCTEA